MIPVTASYVPPVTGKPQNDNAAEVLDRRRRSQNWMKENFWDEWTDTFQNYRCERDAETDPNDPSKKDETQTSLGMPDTWALVRRTVARVTAQLPSLKFRADDEQVGERISRTLMYQWDRGGVQRIQKKHVLQASLFGWSARPWSWVVDEFQRKRRVNPLDPQWTPQVFKQYADRIQQYVAEGMDPNGPEIVARLMGDVGRGMLVPIQYLYKSYEGPKTEFLFVGDCYPEPNFITLQSSNWFIVERRRNKEWLTNLAKAYPELAKGVETLLTQYPNGTPRSSQGRVLQQLRTEFLAVANRTDVLTGMDTSSPNERSPEWNIIEQHVPGKNSSLTYVGEEGTLIGQIPYPYELDGKIAFTELVFIDDLLCGVGDSHARVLRGLNQLHNRQVSQRSDLIYNVLRPLVWTRDQRLYDNPDLLKRGPGFRLLKSDTPPTVLGEQAALAAAAAGLQDETAIMRLFQMATGESNMSNAANVDPSQSRTATGARIMAFYGDLLTKDAVDMFTETSLKPDLEMMYLLNRSELTEAVSFDASKYQRYSIGANPQEQMQSGPQQPPQPEVITATPEDFQYDGEVEVEVGSTLADDDDANVTKAQTLFQYAVMNPDKINPWAAAEQFLIAMGKGKELGKWLVQPQPPPAPPPQPPRANAAFSFKGEMLPPPVQEAVIRQSGIDIPEGAFDMAEPMMPEVGPDGAPMGPVPVPPMPHPKPNAIQMPKPPQPRPNVATSALDAAEGKSPLRPVS